MIYHLLAESLAVKRGFSLGHGRKNFSGKIFARATPIFNSGFTLGGAVKMLADFSGKTC